MALAGGEKMHSTSGNEQHQGTALLSKTLKGSAPKCAEQKQEG